MASAMKWWKERWRGAGGGREGAGSGSNEAESRVIHCNKPDLNSSFWSFSLSLSLSFVLLKGIFQSAHI
jgi:hypothetical protein